MGPERPSDRPGVPNVVFFVRVCWIEKTEGGLGGGGRGGGGILQNSVQNG